MWIRTAQNTFVNTNEMLLVQLQPDKNSAFIAPLVAGDYRGWGNPYFAVAENYKDLENAVKGWCDLGENEYLNVDRFALVHIDEDAPKAMLYLAERGGLEQDFTFEGERARKIAHHVQKGRR